MGHGGSPSRRDAAPSLGLAYEFGCGQSGDGLECPGEVRPGTIAYLFGDGLNSGTSGRIGLDEYAACLANAIVPDKETEVFTGMSVYGPRNDSYGDS